MSDPVTFDATSPRLGLPMLFPGQAQKEFYINEAHALIDALLHPVVEGTLSTPPAQPSPGACWIIGSDPTAEWFGHEGKIACHQAGSWLFANPCDGMRIFDRSAGAEKRFNKGWQSAAAINPPAGGATVDSEARAAIGELIQALASFGLIPRTS